MFIHLRRCSCQYQGGWHRLVNDSVIDVVIVYSSYCNMVLLKADVSSYLGWVFGVSLEGRLSLTI